MNPGYIIQYWPGTVLVKSLSNVLDEADTPEGWVFIPFSDTPPPMPVDDPALAEAAEFSNLASKQRQANAQVTALQGRVDAIKDAIEFEDALPEEIEELPIRSAQLDVWKKYRIKLGRVTGIPGWYQTPTYPDVPEPYTGELAKQAS